MSVIAMSAPRASVFTFESTAHSSHVLRCLDDQRRRDVLCDVTVVAEGQGFRAHRSVLAACSEYFMHRISPLTQHGAVITLPQEVTAAGFEPLLKFAYTSKLLFGKNDILEIRNSASILGFRDLDDACFDFLLPKFFSSSKESVPFPRKTCCKKTCKRQSSKEDSYVDSDEVLLDEKEAKPVADSPSQQEVAWLCNKSVNSKIGIQNTTGALAPVAEGANDIFVQCPKYRKFQLACGKETCVPGKSLNNQATAIRDDCDLSCTPCSSGANGRKETVQGHPTRENQVKPDESWKTEIHEKRAEDGVGMGEALVVERDINERVGKWDEEKKETIITDVKMEEKMEHSAVVSPSVGVGVKAVSLGQSAMLGERSPVLILHHCTVRAIAEGSAATRSMGQERFVMDIKEDKKPRDSGALEPPYIHQMAGEQVDTEGIRPDNAWEERGKGRQTSSVERATLPVNNSRHGSDPEREVAEHRAMPPGSDVGSSQLSSQDPDPGSSSDKGSGHMQNASLDWLKLRVNLNPSGAGCPFFQDLDQSKCLWKGAGLSESEGASHSGVSSLNSGEDGDSGTETEGDSESYTMERARQVQLPFTVDSIVDLSRNDFQQLLKQHVFTREQLEFVHDMRRRSKNRLAAQRCRKRKLDCIYNLQCEINKLKTEREKLIMEKSQLSQMKLKTCHSVSALCQRVCSEANLRPEQLQVLAKYTSPDCPLSSYFPHIDALLSLPVHPPAPLSSRSAGPGEAWPSPSGDTVTGDGQHSL